MVVTDDTETTTTNLLLLFTPHSQANIEPETREATESQEILQQRHHLQSTQTTLLVRQFPSHGLSFQLWPAASTLVSLLDKQPHHPSISSLSIQNHRPIRVLELGSGTGLVGIAAAALLGAHVILTDLPHVLPNLHFNAAANASAVSDSGRGGTLEVRQLRWSVPEDHEQLGRRFDLLLASDVVYHDHLFDPLLQSLKFFLSDGCVEFVMAHLRRWKKDSVFFKMAKKSFDVSLIHRDLPCPGSRTGIAVYRFTKKVNQIQTPKVKVASQSHPQFDWEGHSNYEDKIKVQLMKFSNKLRAEIKDVKGNIEKLKKFVIFAFVILLVCVVCT